MAFTTTAEIESHLGRLISGVFVILIISFGIMGKITILCGFRFMNVVGEQGSEGMHLRRCNNKNLIKAIGNNFLVACNFVINKKAGK